MSLNEVWEAASATPFTPLVDKDSQFSVGFTLLLVGKLRCLRSFDNRLLTILDSTGYDYALRPE